MTLSELIKELQKIDDNNHTDWDPEICIELTSYSHVYTVSEIQVINNSPGTVTLYGFLGNN